MIICDYCTEPATRVSAVATAEPLCVTCARQHFGADWRANTRTLGVRALRELAAARVR